MAPGYLPEKMLRHEINHKEDQKRIQNLLKRVCLTPGQGIFHRVPGRDGREEGSLGFLAKTNKSNPRKALMDGRTDANGPQKGVQ